MAAVANRITCAAERICMFLFCVLAAFDQIGRESDWITPIIWQRKQQVQSGKVCTGNGLVIIWPHAQKYTSDETDVDILFNVPRNATDSLRRSLE